MTIIYNSKLYSTLVGFLDLNVLTIFPEGYSTILRDVTGAHEFFRRQIVRGDYGNYVLLFRW